MFPLRGFGSCGDASWVLGIEMSSSSASIVGGAEGAEADAQKL